MVQKVLVLGATGNQGGATLRHLRKAGVAVRALTRKPNGKKAQALSALGAEVVAGNMDDPRCLDAAMAGVDGVFSVQNGWEPGNDEVKQGVAVVDAAVRSKVAHLVYTSVPRPDDNPGIKHFTVKDVVEKHLRQSGLTATILRPVYFMDNLNPTVTGSGMHWSVLRDVLGDRVRLQMISAQDIGWFACRAFLEPQAYAGRTITLAGDDVTHAEALAAVKHALGMTPTHRSGVAWLAMKLMPEARKMFDWYREPRFNADVPALRAQHPGLQRIGDFFAQLAAPGGA